MSIFLTVAILHFFAVASPGPDFILVTRQCMRYGRRVALWTSLGIALGILFHVALSLTGLTILIQNEPSIFWYLKLAATLYIGYLGLVSLFSRSSIQLEDVFSNNNSKQVRSVTTGFLTNVLNPKAFIFFVTVFTLVIDIDTTEVIKISLGVYMSLATFIWFSFISILITNERAINRFRKSIPWIERVTGLLLLFIALQIFIQDGTIRSILPS